VAAIARFKPKFHYELIACGLSGHELVGTDAEQVRPEDGAFVRESGALRWHRCLRCDSWVPLPPPERPARERVPPHEQIDLPLRGKALRDKIVLRIFAVDKALHFLAFGALAAGIFVFASHRGQLKRLEDRLDSAFYGTSGKAPPHGPLHELHRLLSVHDKTIWAIGAVAAAYALLEGAEAIGLWFQRRWAEYLTAVATALFLPLELYELSERITVLRVFALVANLVILGYLVVAKRLFGLRGGAAADEAARARDSGWEAFHRLTPDASTP
jgi:uncharacterized membrane protein (DUF2068 family)